MVPIAHKLILSCNKCHSNFVLSYSTSFYIKMLSKEHYILSNLPLCFLTDLYVRPPFALKIPQEYSMQCSP